MQGRCGVRTIRAGCTNLALAHTFPSDALLARCTVWCSTAAPLPKSALRTKQRIVVMTTLQRIVLDARLIVY